MALLLSLCLLLSLAACTNDSEEQTASKTETPTETTEETIPEEPVEEGLEVPMLAERIDPFAGRELSDQEKQKLKSTPFPFASPEEE